MEQPFSQEEVDEVHLSSPSLIKVIGQLQFPQLRDLERLGPAFHRRIEQLYPVLRPEIVHEASFGPQGLTQNQTKVWRCSDLKQQWSIVLAQSFVAIETSVYTTRDDFVARVEDLLKAVKGAARTQPVVVDRLGVRFVNRVVGEEAESSLETTIRPELYGPLSIQLPPDAELLASIGHMHIKLNGPQVQARWGRVGANAMIVPDIEPVPVTSWLLDIDVFDDTVVPFDPVDVAASARVACVHAYHFFRWAMSENFIESRR